LPYLARKHGEREINVTVRAVRLPTGVYPARERRRRSSVIRRRPTRACSRAATRCRAR
jgi:opine dehydrogenase